MLPRAPGLLAICLAGALTLARIAPGVAQEIPRDKYLRYVPLIYPRLIRASPATERFQLYGDSADPGYRDESPQDGIDDARAGWLGALAVRFAPYLVRNTEERPLDFRRVYLQQDRWRLLVDRWNIARNVPTLVASDSVDLTRPGPADDAKLLDLLARFDPDHPTDPGFEVGAVSAGDRPFSVLFIDGVGYNPSQWHQALHDSTGHFAAAYAAMTLSYVHPFIRQVAAHDSVPGGYELVMQYWFFYPSNRAGNNHEGDWEHINVIVSPRSAVEHPLSADQLTALLAGPATAFAGDDPLVMRRIDYYFHHWIMPMDFSAPNAYLPRAQWEQALEKVDFERIGEVAILRDVRKRAWADQAETIVNTHPLVFVGGNSKGLDLLFYGPGARNQNSHGSYPFTGLFKRVGPGSNEEITRRFDQRDYFTTGRRLPDWVTPLDSASRLKLLPDWERVLPLIRDDSAARGEWSWLVLPIRWGYPAAKSPLAGIVAYAETGNLSPAGPAFNNGWNTSEPVATFDKYVPNHLFGGVARDPQDVFSNDLGFINAPVALVTTLPPIDFVYKLALTPFRAIFGDIRPTYYAASEIPYRVTGPSLGLSAQFMDDETWPLLFFTGQQANDILDRLAQVTPDTVTLANPPSFADNLVSFVFGWDFYLGNHWVTENTLRHSRTTLGVDLPGASVSEPFQVRGQLNLWEYAGSLRYNVFTGHVMPFLKVGYGLSWYRLEDITTGGVPIEHPATDWVRQPSIFPFHNVLPNTLHWGVGVEYLVFRHRGPFPRGMDLALKADYTRFHHSLGITFNDRAQLGLENAPGVSRSSLNFTAAISF
jgi:hypothetical protein